MIRRPAALALTLMCAAALAGSIAGTGAAAQTAQALFAAKSTPTDHAPTPIGGHSRGCLAGAVALPETGPTWQAMRLSRNRNWGHPNLVAFIERLGRDGRQLDAWPGLLVGDMAQPRGGPMRTGHASHQIGLDADLWLTPMPDRVLSAKERESISAVSMLADGSRHVDPRKFTEAQARIIRRAALDTEVERIFVHPGIKQALCLWAGEDRDWLHKVRPWWGHDAHFHVRLSCPPGQSLCRRQEPAPPGDGCGKELEWWLSDEPWKPAKPPAKPPKPMMLADLPAECREVLRAR